MQHRTLMTIPRPKNYLQYFFFIQNQFWTKRWMLHFFNCTWDKFGLYNPKDFFFLPWTYWNNRLKVCFLAWRMLHEHVQLKQLLGRKQEIKRLVCFRRTKGCSGNSSESVSPSLDAENRGSKNVQWAVPSWPELKPGKLPSTLGSGT